ncbi:hypothetical protein RRG08_009816 [Elysia crispata]|uniref:Uncharacterized protein n=1 Tax=Elysia crispata TaxID=231223 RepID=A0AAE0Z3X6_9GAST|nr:hypothetical protein RRG08_009816 [Elysia crispata]
MLVYIALTFALALSAVAKEECSKDCKAEFWDKAEKDTPNESCEAGKLWRACLNKQQIAGCPNVEYTQELDGACHQTDFKDCSKMSKCSTLDKMQGNSPTLKLKTAKWNQEKNRV